MHGKSRLLEMAEAYSKAHPEKRIVIIRRGDLDRPRKPSPPEIRMPVILDEAAKFDESDFRYFQTR